MFCSLNRTTGRRKKNVHAWAEPSQAKALGEVTLYKCEKLTRKANVIKAKYKFLFGFFFSFSRVQCFFSCSASIYGAVDGAVFHRSAHFHLVWQRAAFSIFENLMKDYHWNWFELNLWTWNDVFYSFLHGVLGVFVWKCSCCSDQLVRNANEQAISFDWNQIIWKMCSCSRCITDRRSICLRKAEKSAEAETIYFNVISV